MVFLVQLDDYDFGRNVGFKELVVTVSCRLTLGKQCLINGQSERGNFAQLWHFPYSKVLILDTWLEVLLNSNFCALVVIKKLLLHTIQRIRLYVTWCTMQKVINLGSWHVQMKWVRKIEFLQSCTSDILRFKCDLKMLVILGCK